MSGWRVMVQQDSESFLKDQLKILIAFRDPERGLAMVKPFVIDLTEPFQPIEVAPVEELPEPTVIPTDLAHELFEQLAYYILQVTDPIKEIHRLRNELKRANTRVDNLIHAMGQLGNSNSAPKPPPTDTEWIKGDW